MQVSVVWIAATALFSSWLLTEAYRRFAVRRGLLDRPNERSSHVVPTPRGGGIAVVLASTGGFLGLLLIHELNLADFAALACGLPIAGIGFVDDQRAVPARLRLVVHVGSVILAGIILSRTVATFDLHSIRGIALFAFIAFGTVWSVNLFNFMDGIDGIAASEATFIAIAGGLLLMFDGGSRASVSSAFVFAACSAGFLGWNWPPARIFMGDVGSGFLGFVIAILAVLAAMFRPSDFYVWLILSAAFVTDSTVTLTTRFVRNEAVTVAHKTHTYQRLALKWGSHRRVTVGFLCVNVGWLLPLAAAAAFQPTFGLWLALISYVPLVVLAVLAGAGRALPVSI